MSTKFFDNFGKITYNNRKMVNILARPKVLERVTSTPYAFYPYECKDFDRPDTIASAYYQSPFFSWIVYLSNKILDPYYEWPLDQHTFDEHIRIKYTSYEIANRRILYYRVNWDEDPSRVLPDFYDDLPDYHKKYWAPICGANGSAIAYARSVVDWNSETNYYQKVSYAGDATFEIGDLVSTQLEGVTISRAEIAIVNSSAVVLKHVEGNPLRMIKYGVATPGALTAGESANVSNSSFSVTANVLSVNTSFVIATCDGTYPTHVSTITGLTSEEVVTTTDVVPPVSQLSADYTGNVAAMLSSDFISYSIPMAEQAYWCPFTAFQKEDEYNTDKRHLRLLDSLYSAQALADLKRLMGA